MAELGIKLQQSQEIERFPAASGLEGNVRAPPDPRSPVIEGTVVPVRTARGRVFGDKSTNPRRSLGWIYRQKGSYAGPGRRSQEERVMPKFQVLCRIDAWANYVAKVEADSAEEAARLAKDSHGDYRWEEDGVSEFDARVYHTLDDQGFEIDHTKVGDF